MKNFQQVKVKQCVNSKFCRVPHGIKSAISTPNSIIYTFQLAKVLLLVAFPICQHKGENMVSLVPENVLALTTDKPMCWKTNRVSLIVEPAIKTAKLSSMFPTGCPLKTKGCDCQPKLESPVSAVLPHFHHCPCCTHCHSWTVFFALETKHQNKFNNIE